MCAKGASKQHKCADKMIEISIKSLAYLYMKINKYDKTLIKVSSY